MTAAAPATNLPTNSGSIRGKRLRSDEPAAATSAMSLTPPAIKARSEAAASTIAADPKPAVLLRRKPTRTSSASAAVSVKPLAVTVALNDSDPVKAPAAVTDGINLMSSLPDPLLPHNAITAAAIAASYMQSELTGVPPAMSTD
ncbi:MAG: hypothetical protein ACK56F_13905 [bacterium]